jgi:hypothetical protein
MRAQNKTRWDVVFRGRIKWEVNKKYRRRKPNVLCKAEQGERNQIKSYERLSETCLETTTYVCRLEQAYRSLELTRKLVLREISEFTNAQSSIPKWE